VDDWEREARASAAAWTSHGGRLLSAVGGSVTRSVDGSNFSGGAVIKTDQASSSYLQSASLAGLPGVGSTPYAFVVFRVLATSGLAVYAAFDGASAAGLRVFEFGGNLQVNVGATSVVLGATGLGVHLVEVWTTGTAVVGSLDGVDHTTAAVEVMAQAVTKVGMGNKGNDVDSPGTAAYSRAGICSGVPTSLERAALLSLVRSLDGF
jgi:hypothetical protein